MVLVSLIVLTVALVPAAQAEIHKCTDEHGNVAYLQTPCPAEKTEDADATRDVDDLADDVAESEWVPESSPEPQPDEVEIPSSRQPGEPLRACKNRYRDQIDEIDAEMRASFSPEQAEAYKQRLLVLTRQLRACG